MNEARNVRAHFQVAQPAQPTAYYLFLTSQTFNGNLGGISGANQKCVTAAPAGKCRPGET